jgi:hypothetical protein
MVLLAAAILAVTPPPTPRFTASAQATATIRIVAAVSLKLGEANNPGAPVARESRIRLADGTRQPAKLIEFQ